MVLDARAIHSSGHSFQGHVSTFASLRTQRQVPGTQLVTPTMLAAKSASMGAAWFVVVAQAGLLLTLGYFGELERPATTHWLLPSCIAFNAAFIYCWQSNPGRVHKNNTPSTVTSDEPTTTWSGNAPAIPPASADGLPLRWCDDCLLWQPLRAKHCDKCGYCVRKFDHHCFWVGGCVGERNHGRFFAVLATGSLYVAVATFAAIRCLDFGLRRSSPNRLKSGQEVALRNAVPLLWVAVGSLMLLFVACLLLWHIAMIAFNQTTWESASRSRISYLAATGRHSAPFHYGLCKNLAVVFCVNGDDASCVDWRVAKGVRVSSGSSNGADHIV